jgi:NADH:ubiquinone oxidoreductase subunit K
MVAFAAYASPQAFTGIIFAVFIITVAAAEVGLALAIILRIFRNRQTANVDELDQLKW